VGLTYPNMQDMSLDQFGSYILSALKQDSAMDFTRCVIGREIHESSGEAHFHAYLYYPNKVCKSCKLYVDESRTCARAFATRYEIRTSIMKKSKNGSLADTSSKS